MLVQDTLSVMRFSVQSNNAASLFGDKMINHLSSYPISAGEKANLRASCLNHSVNNTMDQK